MGFGGQTSGLGFEIVISTEINSRHSRSWKDLCVLFLFVLFLYCLSLHKALGSHSQINA